MKIGICSAMAKEIDISLDYIGVDRGIEVLIDQGINQCVIDLSNAA